MAKKISSQKPDTLKLQDVIDIDQLKELFELQYKFANLPVGLLDIHNQILIQVGWQDICLKFHRAHPETEKLCQQSDSYIQEHLEEGKYVGYRCNMGLWDYAIPIMVEGKHLGNLFFGQILIAEDQLDKSHFAIQAKKYDFEEEAYLEALHKVPRIPKNRVEEIMAYYSKLVDMIVDQARQKLALIKETRIKEKAQKAEQKKSARLDHLLLDTEKLVKQRTEELAASEERYRLASEATGQGMWDWDVSSNEVYYSPQWKKQVGYSKHELANDFSTWESLLHPEDKDRCKEAVFAYLENPRGKFILEFRFRHKKGHYIWIHNECASLKNKEGKVSRLFGTHTDITRIKEAEERQDTTDSQFRIVFQESPLGKSLTGLDGSLKTNRAFGRITGYSTKELQKLHWKEITHPEDIEVSEKAIQSLMTSKKKNVKFDKRYKHKKGHYVWTEVITTLHRDSKGQPVFFITTINDISKRKDSEEKTLESERKFRNLFQYDPNAILLGDPKTGVIVDANTAAEKLMGMKRKELIGMHQMMLHPEEIRKEQAERFRSQKFDPEETIPSRVLTKSGKVKEVEISVNVIDTGDQDQNLILGIFKDVTAEKEARLQILRERDFSNSVINSLPGIFYLINSEGHFVMWNDTMEKLTGKSPEELKKISPLELYPDYHKRKVETEIGRVFQEGESSVEADFLINGNEPTPFHLTGRRIDWLNEPHLVGVGMNVSERVVAEKASEKLMQELKRSNEELEKFAYVASHDLQEPLRMVASYTQLLERKYKDQLDDKAGKYIYYAVDGASRMQQLINDLLDFSRINSKGEEFRETDTNKVLDRVLNNLSVRIKETQSRIILKDLPTIYGDPSQIERVFTNLIGNALKFRKEDILPLIHITGREEQNEWHFTVKDNGIGIDPKFKEKIFVIFQRLHGSEKYPGTGIGLSICKRIVERHGGKIGFESAPGKGTTFSFTIHKGTNKPPKQT